MSNRNLGKDESLPFVSNVRCILGDICFRTVTNQFADNEGVYYLPGWMM